MSKAPATSVEQKIAERFREKGRGWCFTSRDFHDLGSASAVRVTLFRLTRAGILRRLSRGLYDFPRLGANGLWQRSDAILAARALAFERGRAASSWLREEASGYGVAIPSKETTPVPRILILAGPNGAGKTTFAREYLPREADCPVFVNVDLIAAGLSPFSPDRAALQAGKIMLEQMAEHVRRRESFAFETTLSGVGYARLIPRWRKLGFHVHVTFLFLPSADMAVSRVANRIRQGGHSIPEAVIRRRYEVGWRNFQNLYRKLPDTWHLYDNSGPSPVLMDKGANKR